jgi:hypothetical protein
MEEVNIHPLAQFIRLKNGDDVIAEVVEIEDEDGILYTLFNPLKVDYIPSQTTGYLSIAVMPWVFPRICDQQEFVIHAEDILMITNVSEKMNIYYWDSVDAYLNKPPTKEEIVEEPTIDDVLEEIGIGKTYH